LRSLKAQEQNEWPQHFKMAWQILHEDLRVSKEDADAILSSSITAAHVCAEAINRKNKNIVEFQTRNKLRTAFKRIANCAKRASADLRHNLDTAIIPQVKQKHIDLETLEEIFDVVVKSFESYADEEAAKTALAVLTYVPPGGKQYRTVQNSFSGLSMEDQRECENEIRLLARSSIKKIHAADVFTALAAALERRRSAPETSQIHDLIVDYLTKVAEIWRRFGLRPSRAGQAKNQNYRSRFHVFSDLVLTEILEPTSLRHTGDRKKMLNDIRQAYEQMPADFRSGASQGLRRADSEWLISSDHVTKALRR
jgi:hypothetical protein